jgi:Xaa-Pro aminopeptidase
MHAVRISRLIEAIREEKAQAFFLSNEENSGQPDTEYLTGFSGTTSQLLVTAKGECFLFVDGRYIERAKKEARGINVVPVSAVAPFSKSFALLINKLSVKKILIDGKMTSVATFMRLKKMLPGVSFSQQPGSLQKVRIIKDVKEIALVAKACAITRDSFDKIKNRIAARMTEIEVAKMLEKEFYLQGATGVAFPSIVASGENGSQPHAVPTNKKLRKGELVTIDCGAAYRGYMADFTRTIVVGGGSPPARLKRHLEAVIRAQRAGCAMILPGLGADEIDGVCRAVLREAKMEEYFAHGTGHGVGREVHEMPIISPRSDTVLQPGMILTVEPGVYIPGVGGIRIEDTILVTKKGFKNLTG